MRTIRLSLTAVIILFAASFTQLVLADTLWIDVRSPEEYQQDHIAGDPNIPFTEISNRIGELTQDKNAAIALYCHGGRRAGVAEQALKGLGFTNVRNAGGIEDARKERATSP